MPKLIVGCLGGSLRDGRKPHRRVTKAISSRSGIMPVSGPCIDS